MATQTSTECSADVDRQVQPNDASNTETTIITLSPAHDQQQLRTELLRMILRNEARRRGAEFSRTLQDTVTTEGSAGRQVEAAKS